MKALLLLGIYSHIARALVFRALYKKNKNEKGKKKEMAVLFNEYQRRTEVMLHDIDVVEPIREAMGDDIADYVAAIVHNAEQCSAEDWDTIEQQEAIIEQQKTMIRHLNSQVKQLERDNLERQNHCKAIEGRQKKPKVVSVKVRKAG